MDYRFWLFTGIFFFIVEVATPGVFLFSCFGLSAIITGLVRIFMEISGTVQWVLFIVLSITFVILSRPLAKKLTGKKPERQISSDDVIGKTLTVIEVNQDTKHAFVKYEGETWRIEAENNETLSVGDAVTVLKMDGTKLIVKK